MNWKHRAGALLLALVTALSLAFPAAAAPPGTSVAVTGVTLSPGTLTLKMGGTETGTLTAAVEPADATDQSVTWSSSNSTVAEVDNGGKVTAKSAGTVTITVKTTDGSFTDTCTVTVAPKDPPSVTPEELRLELTATPQEVEAGEKATLSLKLISNTGVRITKVEWSPPSVIQSEKFTGETATAAFLKDSEGNQEVKVRVTTDKITDDGFAVLEDSIIIRVTPKEEKPPLETPALGIAMNQRSPVYINRSTGTTLTALTTPSNATDPVTWEIVTGENVVKLVPDEDNDRRCVVEGLATGAATVIAKAGKYQTAPFVIEVSGITLDPLTLDLFEGGEPGTLVASRYGAARTMQLIWESQSEPIANVVSGKVYPNGIGTAKIIVSAGANYRAECTVTVKENVAGIIEAGSVQNGASFSFSERGLLSDLRSRCKEMTGQSLKLVRGLAVSPSQGVLYYKYSSTEFQGQGVGSEPYYLTQPSTSNPQRLLEDVTFVPALGFTGNADISYTGESTEGKNFNGTIRVNVKSTGDVTYSTASNLPVTFEAADFTAICRARQGQEIKYISFQSPTSGKGTLYRNYSTTAQYNPPVTPSDKYYRTSRPLLDEVTFVPAENTTGTVKIPYTCVTTSNGSYTGTVTIFVEDGSLAGEGAVNYTVSPGRTVDLRSADFNSACREATDTTLDYIRFDSLPTNDQGTLYFNYRNASNPGKAISAGTKYYRTGSSQISDITFVPDSGFRGSVTVPFTGYNTRGDTFSGNMVIRVTESGGTVSYSVQEGGTVTFDERDFNEAFRSMTGEPLEYVTFELPASREGKLYRNYRSSSSSGTSVSSTTKLYYDGRPNISDVTFVAKDGFTGTVSFTYRGYDEDGDRTNGTVEIVVGATGSSTIFYSCTNGRSVSLRLSDFQSACSSVLGGTLSYIRFGSLPGSGVGQLRQDTGAASTSTSYYVNSSPSISQLAFTPSQSYQGIVTIPYTGWDTRDRSFSGRVEIVVTGSQTTASSSFTDLGGYSTEFVNAIEYLRGAGVVNGYSDGRFGPGQPVSRGEFALMVCRAFNLNTGSASSFPDVPANSAYAWAVATAKDLGIAQGSNGNYNPYSSITRQAAMTMICRAMRAAGRSVPNVSVSSLSSYRDFGQLSDYARASVAALVQMGAVRGDSSRQLNPTQSITRAQMAVILYRVMTTG